DSATGKRPDWHVADEMGTHRALEVCPQRLSRAGSTVTGRTGHAPEEPGGLPVPARRAEGALPHCQGVPGREPSDALEDAERLGDVGVLQIRLQSSRT